MSRKDSVEMNLASKCSFQMACLCENCRKSEICRKEEKLLKNI